MRKALKFVCFLLVAALLVGALVFSQKVYLKNAYPIDYKEYVVEYSQKYELDRNFVFAIIRTESNFSKTAQSSVDARGLMQITKETFDWIKGKLGDKDATFDDMYSPKKAVEYGCFLLSYLKKELKAENNILCGYHAGINIATQWLSDSDISRDGEIVNIPYKDTAEYTEKVLKTYEIYQKLYE